MRISPTLFRHAASAANFVGFDGLIGRQYRGVGSIFIAHSIATDRRDYLMDDLRTNAAYLDEILTHLKKKGTEIVTLGEAITRLKSSSPKPFVCFTFDDGYKDNLTVALPIFARHNAPFTVFVTTCMIDRSIDHWWSGLSELIKSHDTVEVEEIGTRFETAGFLEKVSAFRELKFAVNNKTLSRAGLATLFAIYKIDLKEVMDRDALTEHDLKSLASSPYVEIGGHTTDHPHLSQLTAVDARQQMLDNKLWLENLLQQPVRHFAYPYGGSTSCGQREAQLAKDVGFQSAVTTRIGNLFPIHQDHLTALPRLRLFSEHQNLRLIDFQRNGAAGALLSRFGNPAVTV